MSSVSDKFVISDKNTEAIERGLRVGGFKLRLFVYVFFFVPFYILNLLITISLEDFKGFTGVDEIDFVLLILLSAAPFILIEWRTRSWRRKNGFSLYKNIEEELKQRATDERVAREAKALEKVTVRDISYYFDLYEKGAITEEEYNNKKKELL